MPEACPGVTAEQGVEQTEAARGVALDRGTDRCVPIAVYPHWLTEQPRDDGLEPLMHHFLREVISC